MSSLVLATKDIVLLYFKKYSAFYKKSVDKLKKNVLNEPNRAER